MEIIDTIVKLTVKPRDFFKGLKKEKTIKDAFFINVIVTLVYSVIITLFFWLFFVVIRAMLPADAKLVPWFVYIIMFAAIFVLSILFQFVWAGILHLWILIFGGKKGYKETYQLSIYSSLPNYLLGWVPLVGLAAWVYSIYLIVIGTQEMHQVSNVKSVLMYVIPIFVFMMLIILFYVLFIALMVSSGINANLTNSSI